MRQAGSKRGKKMTTLQQIEAMIRRHPRLHEEYSRLKRAGWKLKRKNIWFSNAQIDEKNKILYIDDDEEGPTRIIQWVKTAVKLAYLEKDDLRRGSIKEYAERIFRHRNGRTDLEAMAEVYAWSAWYFVNGGFKVYRWMDDLTLILAGRTPSLFGINRTYYIFKGNLKANSTGFKRAFRDSSNQVRHATASLQASLRYGVLGWMYAQYRERGGRGPADMRLNNACYYLADKFKKLQYLTPYLSADSVDEYIKNLIRDILGDPRETKPWDGPEGGLEEAPEHD